MKILWLALASLVFAAAPTLADQAGKAPVDDVFERGCGDDNGIDRCSDAVQDKMRSLYGFESGKDLIARGITFRRVMLVDGYGRDVVAISAHRILGRAPVIEVRIPGAPKAQAATLEATLSSEVWARVIAESTNFDRDLVRRKGVTEDEISLCLHAWFAVGEAGDARRIEQHILPEQFTEPVYRRDAETACGGGLGMSFAFRLADIAYEALAECGTVDRATVRNIPMLLAACSALKGDRQSAGEALAVLHKLRPGIGLTQKESDRLVAHNADSVQPQLWSLLQSAGAIFFDSPDGVDVDHVTVRGTAFYWNTDKPDDDEEATVELALIRQLDQFVVKSLRVSERRPKKAT
ncbi:hypothetical protein [Sphingomonas sp. LT1P40]|uniref:hypothetical protein n=1 Tax=Alteristakelama amylovorans TaxID=3096166 RepID=UPI002FCC226D